MSESDCFQWSYAIRERFTVAPVFQLCQIAVAMAMTCPEFSGRFSCGDHAAWSAV
ncbi:hypothetical protein [Aeromicrobium piscarium]|uniref:hypothetical protein n=1 Tax=Aeromicrobium piscarium TaxID=2590901 RepID=UPI00163D5126|nr:hypothetical protein [Aeromicrobium piscarium]